MLLWRREKPPGLCPEGTPLRSALLIGQGFYTSSSRHPRASAPDLIDGDRMDDGEVRSTSVASISVKPSYSRSAYTTRSKGKGGKEGAQGVWSYKPEVGSPPRDICRDCTDSSSHHVKEHD